MGTKHLTRRRGVIASAFVAAALIAAACGDDKGSTPTTTAAATTTSAAATTTSAAGTTTSAAGTTTSIAATTTELATTTVAETTTTAPAEKPVVGGKITIAGEAEVGSPWTPAAMNCDSYCQMRARTFFEPLAAVDQDVQLHPYLAESITPNADFTQWTVKLRDGITFSDGEALNADAAIKSIKAAMAGFLIAPLVSDVAKEADGTVKITKVDDMTFTIFTGKGGDPNQPLSWPAFGYVLTSQAAFMAAPNWLDAVAKDPNQAVHPVGTGPFVLDSFTPGDRSVVKRNPTYWRKDANGIQLPYLDEIEFRVIPDAQTRQQALEAGDIDMMQTDDANSIVDLRGKKDQFPMIEQSDFGETFYILLHLTKPVIADKDVRCAMLQAIDKQALIDLTGGGILKPANGPFSPGQEGYLDDNGSLPYDPDAAKAGIDKYKAAHNGETPSIIYSTVPDANALKSATYLQGVWQDAGMKVEIKQIEQSTLITNALFGDQNFDAFGWRNHAGVVVDNQYFWWHSDPKGPDGAIALNFGRMNDPVIDQLLEQQRTEADAAKRKSIAEDINREFAKQCWILPTAYAIWGIPQNGTIHGIGALTMPDDSGTTVRDGAGFPGQVWLTSVWVQQ